MPRLVSLATALPPYALEQPVARAFARQHFASALPNIERYLSVFEHAQIDRRYLVAPLAWFSEPRSFGTCNDLFIQWAEQLGEQAARACLEQAGLAPGDVDHLIFVSTTGMAAPSLDARLINRLGMGRHTRRTPIWGLGCAAGVAGLARAYEYARAFPQQRVLLVSVELCSLTFQWGDFSKRNLVAASLFSDGAAAVLVEGDEAERRPQTTDHRPQTADHRPQTTDHRPPTADRRPQTADRQPLNTEHRTTPNAEQPMLNCQILGTQSTLWPDTLQVMGWDMVDTGMQVVFSSGIPEIVRSLLHENVQEFLAPYGLQPDDISQFILHPGGAKVLRAYEQALGIDPERLQHSRQVLRNYGNMSSATVFFVLEAFARQQQLLPGEYGLLAVLGPGFSSELALLRG